MEKETKLTEMRGLRPELRAVYDLALSAQGAHEIGDLLDRICKSVAETFGFERAGISRYVPETEEIELLAARGIAVEAVRELSPAISDWPFLRRALETRDIVLVEDVKSDPSMPEGVAEEYGVRSVLALPLISGDRCLGFLSADHGGKPFTLDDTAVAILRTIGALAASFLEKALVHEELKRLDKLKTNFLELASHELRTPAAVIFGISSTLHRRGDQLRPDQLDELRSALYEQSGRMRQLVEQLLDLSRLEARAIRIKPEPFPVRRRIEDLVLIVIPDRSGDVEIAVEPTLQATADPDAFDCIVSNLIANAMKYGAPPVTIHAEQRDRHFRLSVEDRGGGVSPEFIPQLFERFTRSEASARTPQGAGLGLSIAQSYAQAHGGEIVYESADPHGARFELVLPR
ncbi:MAG: ATP-binding protein [Actinomycetota bacterium]|nr:ATP-binding protein [Actinomycetota bacterium]